MRTTNSYVTYLGCKFKVLKDMGDGTTVVENCAYKLKRPPTRVKNKHLNEWVEPTRLRVQYEL